MKNLIIILLISFSLPFCREKQVPEKKDSIDIEVVELDSNEMRYFHEMDCDTYIDKIVKKVIVTNNLYDTLYLPVRGYCSTNQPFLLYDAVLEYVNDTAGWGDLIFTKSGYPFDIIKNKTKSVYFYSKILKKNVKYRYAFWADIDSAGNKWAKEFRFFDPTPTHPGQ